MSPTSEPNLQPKPRSFEFTIKLPFANVPDQSKDTSSITKGSALNHGGNDGVGGSQVYRPTSFEVHSSFNKPSGSDGFSGKSSTNNSNDGKNTYDASKPSFQVSVSVPLTPIPPPKPSSSNPASSENFQRPGSMSVAKTNNMAPTSIQSSSAQNGFFSNPTAQQQRQQQSEKLVTLPTTYLSQDATPIKQGSQVKIPTEQSQAPLKLNQVLKPNKVSSQPNYQFQNVHNSYYNGQINPSLSQSQYESTPSVYYYGSQFQPGSSNYEQGQTGQLANSQFTTAPEQSNYDYFNPSFAYGQNKETALYPGSPIIPSSQYELPSFVYPNKKTVTTAPHQYGKAQSGQAWGWTKLPGEPTGRFGQDEKPNHDKFLIDVEDKTDKDNYFAAPIAYPSPGGWTGQKTATPPFKNPSPLPIEPQPLVLMSPYQSTGFEDGQKGTQRPDTTSETRSSNKPERRMPVYEQTPFKKDAGEQHAYDLEPDVVFVPTIVDQQQMSQSTSQSAPYTLEPNYRQYPIGQIKPTSDQRVVAKYPTINRINYSNIYNSFPRQKPSRGTSSGQVKYKKPWGSRAQTEPAPAVQHFHMDAILSVLKQY